MTAGKQRGNRGRPFQPGISGNPNGRPRQGESLAELVRTTEKGRLPKALNLQWARAARGNLRALQFLAERGWGKPVQPTQDLTPSLPVRVVEIVVGAEENNA